MDPFTDEPVLNLTCDAVEPSDGKGYDRDPRTIAKRAEAYMKSTVWATPRIRPGARVLHFRLGHLERGHVGLLRENQVGEAPWSSGEEYEGGNMGHRAPVKGGYFPVPPADTLQDIRNAICLALEQQGVEVEVHTTRLRPPDSARSAPSSTAW